LWLDVYDDNVRAIAAYERAGFVHEGVLREAMAKSTGEIGSLAIMSILRREYEARP